MLRFILVLLLAAVPAMAFQTDCPLMDPENRDHRLVGGHPIYGAEYGGDMANEVRRGDVWRATEVPQPWNDRDAKLICRYRGAQGGGSIVLKVPGKVERCDWLARDVLKPQPVEPGTGGPIEHVFLRIWCTSRP